MSPLHLVFFDTNAEAIGQWVILYDHLTHLELFPYGSFWYQERGEHWQKDGIELLQEVTSEGSPSSILTTITIPLKQPEAITTFRIFCRKQNWVSLYLSETNYQLWLTSQQKQPEERYQLAQKLAEKREPLAD